MAGNFEKIIANFVVKTTGKVEAIPKKFALDMLTSVVMNTPVKTGLLRGNNQIGINAKPTSILEADPSGQAALARGTSRLEDFKIGDTIFITNNVEYAYFVEMGHPEPRTPRAMFQNAVNEAIAAWDGMVVKEAAK